MRRLASLCAVMALLGALLASSTGVLAEEPSAPGEVQALLEQLRMALGAEVLTQSALPPGEVGPGALNGLGPEEVCRWFDLEYADITPEPVLSRLREHPAYGDPEAQLTVSSPGGAVAKLVLAPTSEHPDRCELELTLQQVSASGESLIALYGAGAARGCLSHKRPELRGLVGGVHVQVYPVFCSLDDAATRLAEASDGALLELLYSPMGEVRITNRTQLWPWLEGPPWALEAAQ